MASDRSDRPPFRPADLGWYLLLTLLSIVVLFPVYITFVRAISDSSAALLRGKASLTPIQPHWNAFWQAFNEGHLGRPLLTSLITTVLIVVGQTVTSVLAAYAFAFLDFPFRRVLFGVTVATLLLPIEVTLITNVR